MLYMYQRLKLRQLMLVHVGKEAGGRAREQLPRDGFELPEEVVGARGTKCGKLLHLREFREYTR